MPEFDMAFSLNRSIKLNASSDEDAENKLNEQLKAEGIDLDDTYTLEIYDVIDDSDE